MKPKLFALILTAASLLTAACSPASEPSVAEPVASVELVAVSRSDLAVSVSGYGVIAFDPARQRVITTQIEARVTEILVQPGQIVEKGAALMRLGPSSSSGVDLARARSDAEAAQAEFERQQRLRTDGLSSDADVERARAAALDLGAQASALGRNAGDLRQVASPISGVVDAVLVAVGDIAPAGSQLMRLATPDAIQARINLELEDATRLSAGDALTLTGLDGGEHKIQTTIGSVDVRIDPVTRMAAILAPVPAGQGFLSGEAVRAELVAEVRENAVVAPRLAIMSDEQGDYVFVDKAGVAEQRRVTVGETSGDQTEILSGLTEGERVVTTGVAILSDGMKLKEIPSVAADKAGAP